MVLKTDFVRGMENAQDPLNQNFEEIGKSIEDTGWIDIAPKNDFAWSSTQPARYRVIGKELMMIGQISKTDKTGVFATLPFGPNVLMGFKCTQASAGIGDQATIYANPNGDLQLIGATSTTKDIFLSEIRFLID